MFSKISVAAIIIGIFIILIAAFQVAPQGKIYTYQDPAGQFTFQYSHAYDLELGLKNKIGFVQKKTGGFELMNFTIEPTTFTSIDQMVKTTNIKQTYPITIEKIEEVQGVTWYYLKKPMVVDRTLNKQAILADSNSVACIKNNQLYTFKLREQITDQQVISDFHLVVKSFQFIENQ